MEIYFFLSKTRIILGAFQIVALCKKTSIFVSFKPINNIFMTKEAFLSIAENYYSEFESLKGSSSLYDYEKSLAEMMQKLSCEYMENHLNEGSVTHDRHKKKL